MTTEELHRVISHALQHHIDISPKDRVEWVKFGHALMTLGYDENTFVALSSGDPAESRRVWRIELKQRRLVPTVEKATAKIVALAKAAGVPISRVVCGFSPAGEQPRQTALKAPQPTPATPTAPKLPPVYVDEATLIKLQAVREFSALFNYLCREIPADIVRRVFADYRVGATNEFVRAGATAPNLASAFPYINTAGHCVDVHLQPYEMDGHRWKQEKHLYNQDWLLRTRRQSDRRAPWCLFGEHLAADRPDAPIAIVESEKTALIASTAFPAEIWMATGSLNNLTPERCAGVKNRELHIFPDNDGVAAWAERTARLNATGFDATLFDEYITGHARPGSKDDIADIILRERLAGAR